MDGAIIYEQIHEMEGREHEMCVEYLAEMLTLGGFEGWLPDEAEEIFMLAVNYRKNTPRAIRRAKNDKR